MSSDTRILLIDAGNTAIKAGMVVAGDLQAVFRFSNHHDADFLEFIQRNSYSKAVVSSVLSDENTNGLLKILPHSILINNQTPVPLKSNYASPTTLGLDRLCNAVGTYSLLTQGATGLCIDIGTCIKFDLVSQKEGYLGGSISPGIELRYQSLHDYTGKLPRLSNKSTQQLVGTTTEESIRSGVINGILFELEGFIEQYTRKYHPLTIFITGGDAKYFDIHSKNNIFADENLTLKGLYEIYRYNA